MLGKDFSDLTPEEQLLNKLLLHDINMGYESISKIRSGQTIRFNETEARFIHPWSHENLGYQYEFNKLKDFISWKDYISLPAHAVDRQITGMMRGRVEREEAEKKAREEKAKRDKNNGVKNTANVDGDQGLDPKTAELIGNIEETGGL